MVESSVKPVMEYLVNGPIPVDELQDIKYLDLYIERGVVDTLLDIQFMLEHVCVYGAPKWWKGTVPEFEKEFHRQYHQRTTIDDQDGGRRNQIQAVELLMEMWIEEKTKNGLL